MNKELINKLLLIISILLFVSGLIFVILRIFITNNVYIIIGLICMLLGGLFKIIKKIGV